jgi:hypothetical protein
MPAWRAHLRAPVLFAIALVLELVVLAPLVDAWGTTSAPQVRARLLDAQLQMVEDESEWARVRADLRATNPEWDLMHRMYLALALAEQAMEHRDSDGRLRAAIDRIGRRTADDAARRGQATFLLPYVHDGEFRDPSGRSLFVDGEIALVLAVDELLSPTPEGSEDLRVRIDAIVAQMERGPVMSAESYPDECWTFCNTTALAAIRVSDRVLGRDHDDFTKRWVATAKRELVDAETGLLVSSFRWDGTVLDGPEGSSVWMAAHSLALVDPEFARAQYDAARELLAREAFGFGWSREWPNTGSIDVDSGPVVPLVGASPGASGLALVGATAFGDDELRDGLLRSLELFAFPIDDDRGRRYAAATAIGDAVVLRALSHGALWAELGVREEVRQ